MVETTVNQPFTVSELLRLFEKDEADEACPHSSWNTLLTEDSLGYNDGSLHDSFGLLESSFTSLALEELREDPGGRTHEETAIIRGCPQTWHSDLKTSQS